LTLVLFTVGQSTITWCSTYWILTRLSWQRTSSLFARISRLRLAVLTRSWSAGRDVLRRQNRPLVWLSVRFLLIRPSPITVILW